MRAFTSSVLAALAILSATAQATDIAVTADTNTDTAIPGSNFGSNGVLAVSGNRIALLRFDNSSISRTPGGDALLNVKVLQVKKTNSLTIRLIRGPWSENTVTANTLPPISPLILDERPIGGNDAGRIVRFDVTGALAAWRNDPAQNFGIAIVSANPAPNLQLGARELHSGATISITGPAVAADRHFWIATRDSLDLIAADGTRLVHVTKVAGLPLNLVAGPRSLSADPVTGGVWVADTNNNRVFRLGPTGSVEMLLNAPSPMSIAGDSRPVGPNPLYSGVWFTVSRSSGGRDLVKVSRQGQELDRVTGFSNLVWDIGLNEDALLLWAVDGLNNSIVRLVQPDSVNGYDVSGPSGIRHTRIPLEGAWSVSVNPNRDIHGFGTVWAGARVPKNVVKLTNEGTPIFSRVPAMGGELRQIEVSLLNGSAVALMANVDEGYDFFSTTGVESRRVLVFQNVPDINKVSYVPSAGPFALDPYRDLVWAGIGEVFQKNGQIKATRSYLTALRYPGHEVRHVTLSGPVRGIAPQWIKVSLAIGNDGVVPLGFNNPTTISFLSRGGFDALQIDPATVRFGPFAVAPFNANAGDPNGDGIPDLVFQVPGEVICSDIYEGLTGVTFSGVPVSGNVAVRITGCGE